jgi:hypothetical protein
MGCWQDLRGMLKILLPERLARTLKEVWRCC